MKAVQAIKGFSVRVRAGLLLVVLSLFTGAFAQVDDFDGITAAQIQDVYTGVLNLVGTWVGILMGVLAVIVGTMWVVNRLRGGSGIK